MKRFFLFAALLALGFGIVKAEIFTNPKDITVGMEPAFIFTPQSENAYPNFVICSGYDASWDGVYSESDGDAFPSLWVFSKEGTAEQKLKFPFLSVGANIRPYIDEESGLLYTTVSGTVRIYSIKDFSLKDSIEVGATANSTYVIGDRLFVTYYPYTGNGTIKEFSVSTHELKDSIETDVFPNMMVNYGNKLIVLSEGSYGTLTSKAIFYDISGTAMTKSNEILLGGTGNQLTLCGKYLYATMNSSLELKIMDLTTETLVDSVAFTNLNAYTGPRQTAVFNPSGSDNYQDYHFCTVNYGGQPMYGIGTKITETRESDGNLQEAVNFSKDGGILAVATSMQPTYAGLNLLTLYATGTSVQDATTENSAISCYPNPVITGNIKIKVNDNIDGEIDLFIYSANGTELASQSLTAQNGEISFDITNFNHAVGKYFAIVKKGNKTYTTNFVVTK